MPGVTEYIPKLMKQVIQNFRSGELKVEEVPAPALTENMVLVENYFSLISSGTERGTVKVGKANILNKARQRPDLVSQVMQNIKKEGIRATLDKVRTKLDTPKALGYSTAGVVLGSMDSKHHFQPGDRVACAGQDYASHAEVVTVPQNLVAKIPDNVSFEEASYTTVGAIALQGVRQADPRIGDNICVIGLGLIGQITGQILKANGCNVFGVDLSEYLVATAKEHSVDEALQRNDENLLASIKSFTKGYGFDHVIITAATNSNDPVDLAAEILRRKGRVVVVGAVKMDLPREPNFYKKELELRMSCSYGPGRYDASYEEYGIDYPYDYVRWTEQRNMEAFLQLLSKKLIDVKPFTTSVFPIDRAVEAYDLITNNSATPFIGLLLQYPQRESKKDNAIKLRESKSAELTVGFIGAGSFAQSYLLPHVKASGADLKTVVTRSGINTKNVAEKFGFAISSTEVSEVINDKSITTVFIATRHDSHAEYLIASLKAGKHVFVEKPMALNTVQLEEIAEAINLTGAKLMVGFNRRFSPLSKTIKKIFPDSSIPMLINIRVNAGVLPKGHWVQDKKTGGGRIIGEVCHFVDLLQYLTGSDPVKVFAESTNFLEEGVLDEDNISVQIKFQNGSLGNIIYTSVGAKSLAKERIEIFSSGRSFVMDDFKQGWLFQEGESKVFKLPGKGHKQEIEHFFKSLKENLPAPISFDSLYKTSLVTFKIIDSLYTGLPQAL